MLALFGSLAGFISSFIPEIFNFFKDAKDKKHEIEIIKLQIEAMKYTKSSRLNEIYLKADIEQAKHLYSSYTSHVGVKWVDSMSALVRPLITYSFFLLYVTLKLLALVSYYGAASLPVWTEEDQAIFCAVIGFWFGARAFGRHRFYGGNGTNGNGSVNGHGANGNSNGR